MAGMIADIGESARIIRRRRRPNKPLMIAACAVALIALSLMFGNAGSEAAADPPQKGWQAVSVWLPQTSSDVLDVDGLVVANYRFAWNSSYDFSALNWSAIDTSRMDQKYVLGLAAKIWVVRTNVTGEFPVEITQGDGTSLGYAVNYTLDQESPNVYLTGERTYWRWDRTPSIVYDYKATGSCAIEDAWRNGTWSPEEGISLRFNPQGSLVLGQCDFAVRLLVYDVLMPELGSLAPVIALIGAAIIVLERRRARGCFKQK